jgi:hypothetical protein
MNAEHITAVLARPEAPTVPSRREAVRLRSKRHMLGAHVVVGVFVLGLMTACITTTPGSNPTARTTTAAPDSTPITTDPQPSPDATAPGSGATTHDPGVVGTVVRFTADDMYVDVTIDQDTPAVRDFLSQLPLTVDLEEFHNREKIADLPRELEHAGTPGSDPEDGDLIYYTPWGNLGFYYDTTGIGYSDATLHLGTYDATLDELNMVQGSDVIVDRLP